MQVSEPRKLIYEKKFHIKDRGDCYIIKLDKNDIKDPDLDIGIYRKDVQKYLPFNSIVEIDSALYEIKGLESFAVFEINDVEILVKPVANGTKAK